MTINETWPSFQRAAQSLYGFLSTFKSEKAFLLFKPLLVEWTVVDQRTFMAARGTMEFASAVIVFHGSIDDLTPLAAAVPPSLFPPEEGKKEQQQSKPSPEDF